MRRVLLMAVLLLAQAGVARAQDAADEPLPKFGEYVYVEELPHATEKVAPEYPEAARHTGVYGTVMVQALVDRSGHVVDTRVLHSIPLLDQAAIECVRRWRFDPARRGGAPVAVWIAVPIKFSPDDSYTESDGSPEAASPPGPDAAMNSRAALTPGRYDVNGNPSDDLIVKRLGAGRVSVTSPGQWEGVGVVRGGTYWGVFVYRDDAPERKNRGARGTHLGTLDASGVLHIEGRFTNRAWGFTSTWTRRGHGSGAHR